ncbi:Holliday junction branch migration protein RuvA [Candidatus Fukatsuia anoeciicola]|uniref:Holliday junction branch migration protein RuvA n=1 Tax=Candidatus Fukatsuia anoeciicola TaxID=2994492 RepID=UPI003463C347
MIGRLSGIILEKEPPLILLEVQGVGYEIRLPMTCFCQLPNLGQEVIIFTQLIVRNDSQLLYGFNNKQQHTIFRELIKINSIGPNLALGILSGMSIYEFFNAVEKEEIINLIKLPGMGKKTAKRLVVEMKDRFKNLHDKLFNKYRNTLLIDKPAKVSNIDVKTEAILALITLGYKPQEASRLVNNIAKIGMDCKTLICNALRSTL